MTIEGPEYQYQWLILKRNQIRRRLMLRVTFISRPISSRSLEDSSFTICYIFWYVPLYFPSLPLIPPHVPHYTTHLDGRYRGSLVYIPGSSPGTPRLPRFTSFATGSRSRSLVSFTFRWWNWFVPRSLFRLRSATSFPRFVVDLHSIPRCSFWPHSHVVVDSHLLLLLTKYWRPRKRGNQPVLLHSVKCRYSIRRETDGPVKKRWLIDIDPLRCQWLTRRVTKPIPHCVLFIGIDIGIQYWPALFKPMAIDIENWW